MISSIRLSRSTTYGYVDRRRCRPRRGPHHPSLEGRLERGALHGHELEGCVEGPYPPLQCDVAQVEDQARALCVNHDIGRVST